MKFFSKTKNLNLPTYFLKLAQEHFSGLEKISLLKFISETQTRNSFMCHSSIQKLYLTTYMMMLQLLQTSNTKYIPTSCECILLYNDTYYL